jgi:alkanesulfonate monooxygenase SsuD/methylene tetrahydromethanopterin reductase-like flavin-dependent oxidoreductase (luciferase family)
MGDTTAPIPETGLVLPEYANKDGSELVSFGRQAVDAGFESVWCGETWGYSPFSLLARLAEHVDVHLGTSIANAFARSPASLAAHALTLHEATDGKFVVGLGASTPQVVESFHGAEFERPLRRLRETIEIVDLALSGERIDYDGEIFELGGFSLNHADGAEVPVLNGALGITNIALTIEYADGLLPHMFPLTDLDSAIEEAEKRAGEEADLHVAPSLPTAVSEDGDEARRILSKHVAYYVGSTSFYNDVVADHGFEAEADAIGEAWGNRDHEAAAEAVSEELLDALGIVGTPERARRRMRELLDGPVDSALVSFPMDATEEMFETTLDALPP